MSPGPYSESLSDRRVAELEAALVERGSKVAELEVALAERDCKVVELGGALAGLSELQEHPLGRRGLVEDLVKLARDLAEARSDSRRESLGDRARLLVGGAAVRKTS